MAWRPTSSCAHEQPRRRWPGESLALDRGHDGDGRHPRAGPLHDPGSGLPHPIGRIHVLPPDAATWLLTRAALAQLSTDPVVRAYLEHSRVDEILQPGQVPLPGLGATIVVAFPAVAALEDALAVDPGRTAICAILYDP